MPRPISEAREEDADRGFGGCLFVLVSYSNEKIVGAKVQELMFTVFKGGQQERTGLRMGVSRCRRSPEGPFGAGVLEDDPVALLSAEGRDGIATLLKTMSRSSSDFHRKHSFYTESFQSGVFQGSLAIFWSPVWSVSRNGQMGAKEAGCEDTRLTFV